MIYRIMLAGSPLHTVGQSASLNYSYNDSRALFIELK